MTNEDKSEQTIDTGGGAHVGGEVRTEGGDFVGRDQIQRVDGPVATGGGDAVDLREAQAPVVGATGPVDVQIGDRYYQAAPPERRIPLQRPARAENFVGREQELAWLLAELQPGRVVTVCGPGGIGKSALAAQAIWALAPDGSPPDRFPDGIVTHSFYRQPQAAVAMEAICRAYGEEPRPTPKAAARRALAGRRALLYLDGTEDADDLPSVLEVRGGCGVLVTSRQRSDAASHADRHDLAPLPLDEAVRLLGLWGGEHASDKEAAARACDLVGRLPLAVRLVGRYLVQADEDLAAYVAWLEETPLEALDLGKRRQESVPVLLERSVGQVSERAREALAVAGLLARAPFGREAVAAALERAKTQMRRPLSELLDYGLLLREGGYYQVSHALVHTYARERCAPLAGAVERLAAHYATLAREQTVLQAEGYQRLEGERAQLMRMVEASAARQHWRGVLGLVWAIELYLDRQGHQTDLGTAIRHGLNASRELGDLQAEANCILRLGEVHRLLDEYQEARQRFEEARSIFAQIGDRLGEANSIKSLGDTYLRLFELEKARQCYEEARKVFAQIGDRVGEANCIVQVGRVHVWLNEWAEARQRFEEARRVFAQAGDREGEASCIQALGDVHLRLSELPEARQRFEEALQINAQIGTRLGEAFCIQSLAEVHLQMDELEEAWQRFEEARPIFARIGNHLGETFCIMGLGDVHLRRGEWEKARQRYEEARATYVQIGIPLGEANCIRSLGNVHASLGEWEEARQRYEETLSIHARIGVPLGEAETLACLGLAHHGLGQTERARQVLQEAAGLFGAIGSPHASLVRQWLDELESKSAQDMWRML